MKNVSWAAVLSSVLLVLGLGLAAFGMFSSNFYLLAGAVCIDLSGVGFAILSFREDDR